MNVLKNVHLTVIACRKLEEFFKGYFGQTKC